MTRGLAELEMLDEALAQAEGYAEQVIAPASHGGLWWKRQLIAELRSARRLVGDLGWSIREAAKDAAYDAARREAALRDARRKPVSEGK